MVSTPRQKALGRSCRRIQSLRQSVRSHRNIHARVFRNGLIFAHGAMNSVSGQSREHDKTLNGLEPMSQREDPRVPRSPRSAGIEPAKA